MELPLDISEVCRRTGLTSRTLRFYEARGLVSPTRTYSGRRLYGPAELECINGIVALKRAGLTLSQIARLPHQDLLDFGRLGELMGYDRKLNTLDFPVTPRGYRILGRIPRLPEMAVESVVREFGSFDVMLAATADELEAVDGVGELRAKEIREGLRRLQEINLVDRYLQT